MGGEEYILEKLCEEVGDIPRTETVYSPEVMYWTGYTYRYWHYYTRENNYQIYRITDAKTMNECWLGFRSLDVEMVIDNLKEIFRQKQ